MTNAWLVSREEKHVDPRFWVCLELEDALKIAADVVEFWCDEYEVAEDDADTECYEDRVFNFDADDCFRVQVLPAYIHAAGETAPTGGR